MLQRGRKFVKCEEDMNHNAKIPNIIVKHPLSYTGSKYWELFHSFFNILLVVSSTCTN